jgi:hypothetical protein
MDFEVLECSSSDENNLEEKKNESSMIITAYIDRMDPNQGNVTRLSYDKRHKIAY